MNKETIYIEPNNDITDILSRVKASDKKIIALVPPKKPTVLLSSVNVKLISRAAKSSKKTIVLVTTNDALIKLAMTANLPVASSLKSRPVMPGEEDLVKFENKSAEESEQESEDDEGTKDNENTEDDELPNDNLDKEDIEEPDDEDDDDESKTSDDSDEDAGESVIGKEEDGEDDEDDEEDDEDNDEEEPKKRDLKSKFAARKASKKAKKQKESSDVAQNFFAKYKTWFIIGGIALIGLVLFLVWAFSIAPRVNVSVSVRTTSANFSENVIFTKNSGDENSSNGTFFLHEESIEKDQIIKFTATGKKDMGEHASGPIVVYYQSKDSFSFSFSADSKFAYQGFEYVAVDGATFGWDGEDDSVCESGSSISKGCLKSAAITVKAVAPGEDYNISGQQSGWASKDYPSVSVYNSEDIKGGTSRVVTVVQQSDVDTVLSKLREDKEKYENGEKELYDKLSDTVKPVEGSFKIVTSDPKSTPAVGEEVQEGVTPQVSTKTTYSIYTIDRVRMEEFIKAKATIEEGKRLYSIGEPFIEYFAEGSNNVYTGKLKTTYKTGPEISETEVLDKIRGEKIGRIEPILKDAFAGISSVKIEKSYFWVNNVPNDENKVQIELTIEE